MSRRGRRGWALAWLLGAALAGCTAGEFTFRPRDAGAGGDVTPLDRTPTDMTTVDDATDVPPMDVAPVDVAPEAAPDACPAGRTSCGGACVDLTSDLAHCGMCGNACPMRANGTALCIGGVCRVLCNVGFVDCGSACAQTASDLMNCGSCGNACPMRPNAAGVCLMGACRTVCNEGFGDCDGNAANGCETTFATDTAHCGRCGNVCSVPGATASCAMGMCALAACSEGTGNCDGNAMNGCETNVLTSTEHCGMCGRACAAGEFCSSGTCATACMAPTTNCSMTCVNTMTDAAHCGRCGNACPEPANGRGVCSAGSCGLSCNAGFADCDMMAGTGCEANLQTSTMHCGSCGRACTLANATPACTSGNCTIASCNAGFADCNSMVSDGCEISTATDASNCGGCGRLCNPANAERACVAGTCRITACQPGFGDCNNNVADGCEVNVNGTAAHCGRCGNACAAGEVCSGGRCTAACMAPTTLCASGCVNLRTDTSHCGRCGGACPRPPNATPECADGACQITCNPGFADCDRNPANGCETNVNINTAHCGRCGRVCNLPNAATACAAGTCIVTACNAGFADCNASAADGCEIPTTTVANCGGCGRACSLVSATPACTGGNCQIASCSPGFANCDGVVSNGCEVNINSSTAHCGRCNNPCGSGMFCSSGSCQLSCAPPTTLCSGTCVNTSADRFHCGGCGRPCPAGANAQAVCSGSVCGLVCNPAFGNCNGFSGDGCEADLNSNTFHCGGCNRPCRPPNAIPACRSGSCGISTCSVNFADCNMVPGDGCEVSILTDPANCGGCGRACTGAATACSNGVCCAPGTTGCSGRCVNLAEDQTNCGACGVACPSGQVCGGGRCVTPPSSYSFSSRTGSLVYIQACSQPGAVRMLMGVDDAITPPIRLPFSFTFWGVPYTQVRASSNGYLLFGTTTRSCDLYCYRPQGPLPHTSSPAPAALAFSADLFQRSMSGVCIATVGSAPRRQWVFESVDASFCCGDTTQEHFTFEIVLNEADSSLDFHYRTMNFGSPARPFATLVGLQDASSPMRGSTFEFVPMAGMPTRISSNLSIHAVPVP